MIDLLHDHPGGPMTMVSNKRGTNVRPQILTYFAEHPNRPISVSELAEKLQDDTERIRRSIDSVIRQDRQTSAGVLNTHVPGESWVMLTCHQGDAECDCAIPVMGETKEHPSLNPRVTPTKGNGATAKEYEGLDSPTDRGVWRDKSPAGAFESPERLFQQIGKAKGNAIILKCEDGTIWRAEQM
jgi:hypothetical protein